MEPRKLEDLESGDTLLLASEIQERMSVSQVYAKVDDMTVRHIKTDETKQVSADELVYPFEPVHAAH